MSSCKHFTIRSEKYKKYYFCRLHKKRISQNECGSCQDKEYKQYKQMKAKTNSLKKAEDGRRSILQSDKDKCYVCHRKLPLDTHEAIGGMNRLTSIKWGLILYLCRECHSALDLDQDKKEELQVLAQNKFVELYGYDKFMEEFKMDYIEKFKNRKENAKWKKEED